MTLLAIAALLPVAMTVPENGAQPHEVEVKLFADMAAVAETTSSQCPDILINRSMMSALSEQMHIRPMDGPAVREEAQDMSKALAKAIAEAPTPAAWCDLIYKLYGPDGKTMPKLMVR